MSTKKDMAVFYATLGVAVASLALFGVAVVNAWMGPGTNVGGSFCEAARPGLIKQPANTWSNLGFIIAGLTMAWQLSAGTFAHNHNMLTRSRFSAIFFSSLAVLLGPSSMAMHATETRTGGDMDMLSMYLVAAFTTSYALQRFFRLKALHFTVIFVSIVVLCKWVGTYRQYIPFIHYAGNAIFAFFISSTIILESLNSFVRKYSHQQKWGIYSVLSLVTAFVIWNFGVDDSPLCDPQSLIQGHAMWHLLDALAVYFLFRFYASEHDEKPAGA